MVKLFLVISFMGWIYCFSQTGQVDSLRWVYLDNYSVRHLSDKSTMANDSTLFGSMRKAISLEQKVFYLESEHPVDREMMYASFYPIEQIDSVKLDSNSLNMYELSSMDLAKDVVFLFNEKEPLEDSYEDDLLINYDGNGYHTYLPNSILYISTSDRHSYEVKEKLFFDSIPENYNYQAIAIKVISQRGSDFEGEFWFDLKKYAELNPSVVNMPWYQFLFNTEYKATQYGCLKKKLIIE